MGYMCLIFLSHYFTLINCTSQILEEIGREEWKSSIMQHLNATSEGNTSSQPIAVDTAISQPTDKEIVIQTVKSLVDHCHEIADVRKVRFLFIIIASPH